MNKINTDIVIIGSGITGLTAAWYAKKKNLNFLVIDKKERPGGVISSVTENNFLYEEGPNTGVIGNETVVELFDDLQDTIRLEIPDATVKKRYILKNGRWHALPSGPVSAITTPLFTVRDKFRVLGEPFRSRGEDPHENLADMVIRRLGKSFLDYAIDPFIGGVYAGDPELLIPKYALPKLYNLEQQYGSFIKGAVKKKKEPKTELQKRVKREVFSFKGGLSSLTNALYNKTGKKYFIFSLNNIHTTKTETGFIIHASGNSGDYEIITNNIISTAGAFELPGLFPFIPENQMEKISTLYHTRIIEIALGFNRWEGMKTDAFGGLIPYKENRDLLGILFMSSLFKDRATENGALFSIFIGGVRKERYYDLSDKEITDILEKECKQLLQLDHFNPDLLKIIRHKKAIPQYYIDSKDRFQTVQSLKEQYPGLVIGGNLRDGIGIADRIQQGKLLVEELTISGATY